MTSGLETAGVNGPHGKTGSCTPGLMLWPCHGIPQGCGVCLAACSSQCHLRHAGLRVPSGQPQLSQLQGSVSTGL